jgi:hypothetical protein
MAEREISYPCGGPPFDSFERFTPEQRAAWIDQEREHERWRRAFLREAEARLSATAYRAPTLAWNIVPGEDA